MKMQSAVFATVMAIMFGLISDACSTGSGTGGGSGSGGAAGAGASSGAGGAVGMGGSSNGGGAGASCSNVTPCEGAVVGTWTVTSSCLNVTGELDLTALGASCPSAPVTGSLQVSGTWTANSDGTYSDNTTTSGNEQFTLAPSCLVISSTPVTCDGAADFIKVLGYSSVVCTSVAGGGCTCSATVHQTGTLGVVSFAPSTTGNYTTAGTQVTMTGDGGNTKYSYCASANTLTVTPQVAKPTITGTIVSQNSGTAGTGGTGGATGTAGSAGQGGKSGIGGGAGAAGIGGAGGSTSSGLGPCDIYKSGGTPCVAAHSTGRALFGAYGGPLYRVRNLAGATKDISAVTAGGVADGAAQDTFCSGTMCVITVIYDQTGKGNDLQYQGPGSPVGGVDVPSSATAEPITVGGKKVYSLHINGGGFGSPPGNSYWVDGSKKGIPLGSQPEGMYMVTSGKHANGGCCFDYGNSETDRKADGPGTMDALNFSTTTAWGRGAGAGPWVMADLEFGLFTQNNMGANQADPTQTGMYVTAVLKNNGTTEFALRGGDATSGTLSTYFKGALPPGGYSPMKKQGAIVLGSGGDCCVTTNNLSAGTFYEGCLVSGYPSDATENAVQANIVAAGYGK